MKNLRSLFVVLLISVSTSIFANSVPSIAMEDLPVSREIEKMLMDSDIIIEEEFMVTVVFKVTEDRRIRIHNIQSENEEVTAFLKDRLENKRLQNKAWITDKTYQLPVRVAPKK